MRAEFTTPVEIDTLMIIAANAARAPGVSIIGYDAFHLPTADELVWAHATIRARDEELASVMRLLAAREEELAAAKRLLAAREEELVGTKRAVLARDREITVLRQALGVIAGGTAALRLAEWGRAGARLGRRAARLTRATIDTLRSRLSGTRRRR